MPIPKQDKTSDSQTEKKSDRKKKKIYKIPLNGSN